MKKLQFALLLLLLAVSCNKKNNTTSSLTSKPKDVSVLIAQINAIGQEYKNKNTTIAHRTTMSKKNYMLLADAVGGAISIGGGPYAILWGGFGLSMFAGEHWHASIASPVLPLPNTTGSGSFFYGNIGDDHNTLLYDVYNNGIAVSVNSDNSYNASTASLLTSNNFSNIDGGQDNISTIFSGIETTLGAQVNYLDTVIDDSDFYSEVLTRFSSDNNTNEVINSIIYDMKADISTESSCNEYLLSVQGVIQESASLSASEKNSIYAFLAIANSSMYFWDANGYSCF